MITITVPGAPRGKGSVRATIIGKKKPRARTFTDEQTRSYMAMVQQHAMAAMVDAGEEPFRGPVVLRIRAYRRKGRPGSKVGQDAAEIGVIRPTSVVDCDNYAKAVGDGLNGVCFMDDAQVVRLVVDKMFSERPRMEIEVCPWEPSEMTVGRMTDKGGKWARFVDRLFGDA